MNGLGLNLDSSDEDVLQNQGAHLKYREGESLEYNAGRNVEAPMIVEKEPMLQI